MLPSQTRHLMCQSQTVVLSSLFFIYMLWRAERHSEKKDIKVTGFEPMALCTQNRCADQTALHLVSLPEAYRSTRSMNTNWKRPRMSRYPLRESNPCLRHEKTMSEPLDERDKKKKPFFIYLSSENRSESFLSIRNSRFCLCSVNSITTYLKCYSGCSWIGT